MGTETFSKGTPSPSMKYGLQKKGANIRTPASEGINQVNGGTQGYPNTNAAESMTYAHGRYSCKPKFPATADANLDNQAFASGPSGKSDFKKGARKGFKSEMPGPDIKKGKPGAHYGY